MQKTLNAKGIHTPLTVPPRPSLFNRQMLWVMVFFGVFIWALLESGIFQNDVINSGGFTLVWQFLSASLQPELSGEFIRLTLQATLTTLAFAVVGLFLSVVFGFFGGILASETWVKAFTTARADQDLPPVMRGLWLALRWLLTLFRSVHEDRPVTADAATGAAPDAGLRVEHVRLLLLAGDGVDRAVHHAEAAAGAFLRVDLELDQLAAGPRRAALLLEGQERACGGLAVGGDPIGRGFLRDEKRAPLTQHRSHCH